MQSAPCISSAAARLPDARLEQTTPYPHTPLHPPTPPTVPTFCPPGRHTLSLIKTGTAAAALHAFLQTQRTAFMDSQESRSQQLWVTTLPRL